MDLFHFLWHSSSFCDLHCWIGRAFTAAPATAPRYGRKGFVAGRFAANKSVSKALGSLWRCHLIFESKICWEVAFKAGRKIVEKGRWCHHQQFLCVDIEMWPHIPASDWSRLIHIRFNWARNYQALQHCWPHPLSRHSNHVKIRSNLIIRNFPKAARLSQISCRAEYL